MTNFQILLIGTFICITASFNANSQNKTGPAFQTIALQWQNSQPNGTLEVVNGQLQKIKIINGKGRITGNFFEFKTLGDARLEVTLINAQNHPGSDPTIKRVKTAQNPYAFFLRDVNSQYPIL